MRLKLSILTQHPLQVLFGTALGIRLLYLLDIRHNPFFYVSSAIEATSQKI